MEQTIKCTINAGRLWRHIEELGRIGRNADGSITRFPFTEEDLAAQTLVLMIPNAATGPALMFVGFLMIQGIKDIDFSDFTEAFGPFIMIMFTIFIGSIAGGISAGIIAYVVIKVLAGKYKEVHPFLYILCIPLILYFIS